MAQSEMIEFGVEQGQMLQVLMRHCQTMKRQETLLRAATAVLLAAFLATSLWLQFHPKTYTDAFAGAHTESLKTEEPPKRHSAHLEPRSLLCLEKQPIKWDLRNDGQNSNNFKLKNQTQLHISTKGLYLINLKISYRIAYNQCNLDAKVNADQILTLEVNVTQEHSNYEKERVIVSSTESMLCKEFWLQSITLSRVITLQANTTVRVRINQNSCKFVYWGKNSHLDVTYL